MTATISPPRQTYSPSSVSNQLVLIISIRQPGCLVRHFNFNSIECVTDDYSRN